MAFEIERKFLVTGPFKHLALKNSRIIQAYLLAGAMMTVRIRKTDSKAFLTIKSGTDPSKLVRNEYEYEIPAADAEELFRLSIPGRIVKTRYYIPYGKHIFEVDVFHDKNEGLIIAEVELESVEEQFEKPDWIGEEVTGNPAYYNVNLIK